MFDRQIYKEETQFTFKQANETHTIDDIEALFKASHHYVDVLTFIATNQLKKKTLRQQYQTEVIHIREAVLKLTLHSVEVAKNQITSLSNMISEHHNRSKSLPPDEASPSKDTTTAQVDVLFQELLHQRAGQYNDIVTLQKKAAEAGNALYWAVTTLSDRQNIANLVFDILTDLENAVVEDSKFIPNHMRALMHQNLAMSYYEEAMRLQQETATLKTSSSAAATTTNTIRSHLSKALQHATSSVAIFEQYFQNTLEGSTMMEHLQSIQLQAGISCMMTQYMEAVSYWHAAIDKARRNTRGLHIGIHYERLAIVLYNAAICFMDAQDQLQSKEYALEAKKVVLQLIQANSNKLQTSSSQQEGDYQQVKEFKDLLKMIEDFLQQAEITMEDQRSHLLHRRERQGRAAAPVEVKPVQTPPSNKPSASQAQVHVPAKEGDLSLPAIKRIEDSSGKVKYVFDPQNGQNPEEDVDDDYEWEECTDLEEGCESFVVYDEVTPSSKDATVTIPASDKKKSQDIKSEVIAKEIDPRAAEAHLYEGLDEEEVLELMEVRKRYAHVTSMQDFFQELLTATPTESVAIQKEEKTVAICDCSQQEATIKALQQELHQAKLQQNMLQVKLVSFYSSFYTFIQPTITCFLIFLYE